MRVDSADDKRRVSVLVKLLRDGLRDARFSIGHLARSDSEIVPNEFGGTTSTLMEETFKRSFDGDGLRALHDGGAWRRDLFRREIRVGTLTDSPEDTSRLTTLERWLEDLGILGDDHVAHALGSLLRGSLFATVTPDSPETEIGVAKTADLWSYLLVDACLYSPRRTASRVLRWARGAPLVFETRVLLGRLRAADSFSLANGLAVQRLPRKSKNLNDWLPIGVGIAPSDYLDQTLLRIPCTITPVLSKPIRMTSQRNGVPYESWRISAKTKSTWPLAFGGIRELIRALSLVCDVAVETPMIWTDYGDHAHFGQRYRSSNTGTGHSIPRQVSASPFTARDLKEATRLQGHLFPPTKVDTAIEYWLKSKARRVDNADRLVFLRTALEALFLDDGNRGAQTFRLATNGAWYTGRNWMERRNRYDLLKNVYRAASGAVHAGRVRRNGAKLLKDGQEICRQAILKRLRSKQDPVWRDIVFGG